MQCRIFHLGVLTGTARAGSLQAGERLRRPGRDVAGYLGHVGCTAFLKLGEELQRIPLGKPRFTVICNVDATPVREEEEIRSALQDQVNELSRRKGALLSEQTELQASLQDAQT